MLAIPSTLAALPVMLGDTRRPRSFCASLVAVGTLSDAHNDLKLSLFLIPITHIPPIDPHREWTIGDRKIALVPRASLDEKHLLFPQFRLTPLGHSQCVGPDRGHAERLVDGKKVRQRLHGQAIGDQRGPLRFHEE